MDREPLKQRLKVMIVEGLRLEDKRPDDIDDAAPIFVEGLGLDSIDAPEDLNYATIPGFLNNSGDPWSDMDAHAVALSAALAGRLG